MLEKKNNAIVLAVYAILSWPFFYFVYKFGNPMFGTNDFFSYYKLYQDWDLKNVDAPFNMRLVSSFFVFLLNKTGLHYNTEIAFDQFGLNKQVFFNAVLFNYLCIVLTCTTIFFTLKKHIGATLLSFFGGLLYLFGFGTLFFEFMPITDAFSILLFAIIFRFYLDKSYFVLIPLILLVLQREYIYLALGLIALIDIVREKHRYYASVLIACVLLFGVYFTLRKTLFYTPKYDFQASPDFFAESLVKIKFPLVPYIKQTLMTMNIPILYFLVLLYKRREKLAIDMWAFIKIVLLFVQINIISIAAVFGNNTGRYFYILVPFVIFYCIREVSPLLQNGAQTIK